MHASDGKAPQAGLHTNAMTDKGMIVTAQSQAPEAGHDILSAGGNAIDAAIATALVLTFVDPPMCSIAVG